MKTWIFIFALSIAALGSRFIPKEKPMYWCFNIYYPEGTRQICAETKEEIIDLQKSFEAFERGKK